MVITPAIAHLIREGKIFRINSEIQTGSRYGMQLMDDALFEMFKKRQIKYQDMMERCVNPTEMIAKVRESGLAGVSRGVGEAAGGPGTTAANEGAAETSARQKKR
jgi:Tfp pilus assembly ATPase PilU